MKKQGKSPTTRTKKVATKRTTKKSTAKTTDKYAKNHHSKRSTLGWAEKTLLGIVAVSVVMVAWALSLQFLDTPAEQAKKELETIADDYYIRYLYPRLTNGQKSVEVLSEYADSGIPITYLRQLLLYNNGEHKAKGQLFEKAGCDTNATGVRYYPVEPYGPHDYTANYIWQCDTME